MRRTVIVVSFVLLVPCLIWLVRTAAFVAVAAKAEGRIVRVERIPGLPESDFHQVFTFYDTAGREHTVRSRYGSTDASSLKTEEFVPILYRVGSPEEAEIGEFRAIWLRPLFLSGFVLCSCLLMRLAVWWMDRGRSKITPGASIAVGSPD